MKKKIRSSSSPLWLFFALAISVVVVATSIAPSDAVAKPRPQNTEPLAGDPDGPDQGSREMAKASSTRGSGMSLEASEARSQSYLRYGLYLVALRSLWLRFSR
jgi:hypothetical protein